jgi:hypothetical protein
MVLQRLPFFVILQLGGKSGCDGALFLAGSQSKALPHRRYR